MHNVYEEKRSGFHYVFLYNLSAKKVVPHNKKRLKLADNGNWFGGNV